MTANNLGVKKIVTFTFLDARLFVFPVPVEVEGMLELSAAVLKVLFLLG